jgi:predicted ATPase
MITKLTIRNFKCLRDVSVDFDPLTVLIGQNDSGKSSLLEAVHLLGQLTEKRAEEIFVGPRHPSSLAWQRDPNAQIMWTLSGRCAEGPFTFASALSAEGKLVNDKFVAPQGTKPPAPEAFRSGAGFAVREGVRRFPSYARAFVSHDRLRLDPDALRRRAVTRPGLVLSPSGNNLAAVLDALMTGPDRAAVTAMEAALHSAIPTLRGVSTPSAPDGQPGEKTIAFVLANDARPPVTIPCELASDGAMLLTAFLTLAYSDTPDVLLIEEPENGLHPSMLASVLALLRDMSTGKVGNRPRQIILTSHSPLLLNYATPEEIRIVRRDDKGTHVTPMTSVDVIADLMKEFGLGELWYLVGEQGLVEGKKP